MVSRELNIKARKAPVRRLQSRYAGTQGPLEALRLAAGAQPGGRLNRFGKTAGQLSDVPWLVAAPGITLWSLIAKWEKARIDSRGWRVKGFASKSQVNRIPQICDVSFGQECRTGQTRRSL